MIKRLFTTFTKKNYPVIITQNAWNKIDSVLKIQNYECFLFSAKSGGCNGFNYDLQLLTKEELNNLNKNKIKPLVIENNNSKIIIDPLSEMLLLGTTIDYILENYTKGIFENKFVFEPDKNKATSCGCGVSFNPK